MLKWSKSAVLKICIYLGKLAFVEKLSKCMQVNAWTY